MLNKLKNIFILWMCEHSVFWVNALYGDIWTLRKKVINEKRRRWFRTQLYHAYFEHFGSWIGLGATFETIPIFPHGYFGVFISNSAHIGKNVVIFHQVTIGSVNTPGSKNCGAPKISDDVFIGCGAKIIGDVTVGHHARIGANAIVVKDVPPNSVTVTRGTESIVKEDPLNNCFSPNNWKSKA